MSDADYLMAHAVTTALQARSMPIGEEKRRLRQITRIYHLLAKRGDYSNIAFLDDYRSAKAALRRLRGRSNIF